MIIDFTKLKTIIPAKGSITLTVKTTSDGNLAVLYKSKHSLAKADSSYEKDVKESQDLIEKASKDLDKTKAFSGSPEALTAQFEEMISRHSQAEKSLADVINESTDALNARIKELKDKKASKTSTAKKTETPKKEEKPAKPAVSFEGSLFGSAAVPSAPTAAAAVDTSSAESSGDDTGESDDNSTSEDEEAESEELQEVA